ncbi:MAG: alcohol dehydrogenase, partial [Clostridia bacterium]
IALVSEGKVQLDPLISSRFPLREYKKAYEYIDDHRETTMKVLVDVQK